MPEMIPVGNTIQAPQPINPLQSLSGILGIKQQQQNLQTGQYVQQQEQSGAQQQQQAMRERLAVQKMMQTGQDDQGNNIKGTDGQPDPAKILPALGRIAPLTGQAYAQSILKTATDKVGLQSASTTLDANQRNLLGGVIQAGSLSGAKAADINAGIDNLVQAHPEMGNAADYAKGLVDHLDSVQDPDKRKQVANQISSYLQGAQPVVTQPARATVDSGPNIQQGAVAPPASGGGFTPATTVTKALTPSERLPHQATTPAGIVNITPQGAISAPPQAGAVPPGVPSLNPSSAQAATAAAAAQGIAQRVQQAKAADYDRPAVLDALSRARAILASPNAPALGSSFELNTYIKNALSSMGADTGGATNANELVKNLARAEAARSQSSPIGTTDAGRSLLSKGTGSTHIDNAAALNIIDQSIATEMAGRGYLKAVAPFQGDPVKMQAAESRFLSTPHLIHAYELGLKKSPAEVESFKKQNGLSNDDLGAATANLRSLGAL